MKLESRAKGRDAPALAGHEGERASRSPVAGTPEPARMIGAPRSLETLAGETETICGTSARAVPEGPLGSSKV
ncbi:MAG: hypothetical protein HYY25_04535 [Candidatus Wallbacteria bacterium]|nr:hypothetical protein [Candidatus Wallbacteria bacterium]